MSCPLLKAVRMTLKALNGIKRVNNFINIVNDEDCQIKRRRILEKQDPIA